MKKTTVRLLMAAVAIMIAISCTEKPGTQEPEQQAGEAGHWPSGVTPYGISINQNNGDIIVTSNGDYVTNGDLYVYTNDQMVRITNLELGALPSHTVALDNNRLLVLNEGAWGNNDAALSFVDINEKTAITDWFAINNGRGMGDVAQDIALVGNKAYVSVTFSNSIECVDINSGISTRIALDQQAAQNPRYIATSGQNLYVTCYNPPSVVSIDTLQKNVTATCLLGKYHPEGICALNGKLYIASSNISDENYNYSYNNKVYVVDIATFNLVDSITVGVNPALVKVLDANNIVVNSWGDYGANPGGTYIIDVTTKNITQLDMALFNFDIYQGNIYGYTSPYAASKFYKINGATRESTEILQPKKR